MDLLTRYSRKNPLSTTPRKDCPLFEIQTTRDAAGSRARPERCSLFSPACRRVLTVPVAAPMDLLRPAATALPLRTPAAEGIANALTAGNAELAEGVRPLTAARIGCVFPPTSLKAADSGFVTAPLSVASSVGELLACDLWGWGRARRNGGHWKALRGRSKTCTVPLRVITARRSPDGGDQITSTIEDVVRRANRATCRTLADGGVESSEKKTPARQCLACIKSQTYCTSPFLLAVSNIKPLGENDKKLHPLGAWKVTMGLRIAFFASPPSSNRLKSRIETKSGSVEEVV